MAQGNNSWYHAMKENSWYHALNHQGFAPAFNFSLIAIVALSVIMLAIPQVRHRLLFVRR